jgi:hypothetical protein
MESTVSSSIWTELNWGIKAAEIFKVYKPNKSHPDAHNNHVKSWNVQDQGPAAACVGFAVADGILRYLMAKHSVHGFKFSDRFSTRFLWMAAKETDAIHSYPTSFMENEGTTIRNALHFIHKMGCVREHIFPEKHKVTLHSRETLTEEAKPYIVSGYFNLCWPSIGPNEVKDLPEELLKKWLHQVGPIVLHIYTDDSWRNLSAELLDTYDVADHKPSYHHAVCLVGYTKEGHFIIRNSKGPKWGQDGFAIVTYEYLLCTVREAIGAAVKFERKLQSVEYPLVKRFKSHDLPTKTRYNYE